MLIEAHDLRCSYGDFHAVRGIDLAVEAGELYALLGTNGAGKTTTLETLQGHRGASGGSVSVFGTDPGRTSVRRRTGIMLQESGFAAELTVDETIALWAKLAGRDGDAETLLERLDLARRRSVRVGQLSGGERRRLDVIMALYGDPELIFLDEPTTGLDPQSRTALWDLITEVHAAGTTIMLTTHYLEEAQQLADRVGIMHRGELVAEGTVPEILADRPSTIQFELPDGVEATALPVPVDLANTRGQNVAVATQDIQRDLYAVLAWAREHGIALGRLRATEASLDDLFQSIARDDSAELTEETR